MSAILLMLLVVALFTSLGGCSTSPNLNPMLPGGRPPDAIGVSLSDVALTNSGTVAVLATEDLNAIIIWGKRWRQRALTLEEIGRWDRAGQ